MTFIVCNQKKPPTGEIILIIYFLRPFKCFRNIYKWSSTIAFKQDNAYLPRCATERKQYRRKNPREFKLWMHTCEKLFQSESPQWEIKIFLNRKLLCLHTVHHTWRTPDITRLYRRSTAQTNLIVIVGIRLVTQVFVSWSVTAVEHGFWVGPVLLDLALKVGCSSLSVLGVWFALTKTTEKCWCETRERWTSQLLGGGKRQRGGTGRHETLGKTKRQKNEMISSRERRTTHFLLPN